MSTIKPTTRTACNKALARAMDERREQLYAIQDAKAEIMKIEEHVKDELIRQRRTECLKIDWNRVKRVISF
jgi:hypothetical protein